MNYSKLSNQTVKQAFDAWQNVDSSTFMSFFSTNTKLYHYGNPRDFFKFIKDACENAKFTNFDKVGNNGLDITSNFHSEK